MQVQPRLSLSEYNDLVTWRPPCSLYSTWPAHRPLTDRSPWWRHFTETRAPARSMSLPPAAFERHVDEIAAHMRTLENPWQGEGPGRSCIRARLVLTGAWSWADADWTAQEVVGEALRRCGCTTRPTWAEGQPDWTQPGFELIDHTNCKRCGAKIPEGRARHWRTAYCSARCHNAANSDRHRQRADRVTWEEHRARLALQRQATEAIRLECEHCRRSFQPAPGRWRKQRFCSVRCADLGKAKAPKRLQPKPCARCGVLFQPRKASTVYCSPECHHPSPEPRACLTCGTLFTPGRNSTGKYCALACFHRSQVLAVRGVERMCVVCSTIFRVNSKADRQKTCSKRCGGIWSHRGTHARKPKPAADEDDGQHKARRCA